MDRYAVIIAGVLGLHVLLWFAFAVVQSIYGW